MAGLKKNQWSVTRLKTDNIFSYQWTIENYSYFDKNNVLHSTAFSINSGTKLWSLSLHPNGSDGNKNNVDFTLHWDWPSLHEPRAPDLSDVNTFQGLFYMSVLNHKGEKFAENATNIGRSFKTWNTTLLTRDILWDKANNLLPNNSLTIRCEFIPGNLKHTVLSNEDYEISLEELRLEQKGIGTMFLEEQLSDVKLIASCGKSLPAHRCILAAFSRIFRQMFVNDMREKAEGEVKILDGKYETIQEMLRFIYMGKVENLTSNAAELISLADKYEISEVRALCQQELSKTMSTDNIIDILAIAHHHSLDYLMYQAKTFISLHHRAIVNSEDYKSLTNIQLVKIIGEVTSQGSK